MSGDLRDRIMEHVDVFEKCGKQQSAAFLREINERIDSLEAENAKLRAELAVLRAAPRKHAEWRNNTTPEVLPYRVENQQQADVTQDEWRSV